MHPDEGDSMGDEAKFDALAVIDAVGPMVAIPIAPEYREGIATNLRITADFGACFSSVGRRILRAASITLHFE